MKTSKKQTSNKPLGLKQGVSTVHRSADQNHFFINMYVKGGSKAVFCKQEEEEKKQAKTARCNHVPSYNCLHFNY
jgi:hypothetical protein